MIVISIQPMETRDDSGKPRTREEVVEALRVVEETIVRNLLDVPPILGVSLPTIREALIELLERREKDE